MIQAHLIHELLLKSSSEYENLDWNAVPVQNTHIPNGIKTLFIHISIYIYGYRTGRPTSYMLNTNVTFFILYILFIPIQPRCHYTPWITITWETMIWNNHVRATNEYYHRQYVAHFMLSQDRWHRCACKSMAAKWGFNIGYPSYFLVTTCVSNAFSNSCYWWFIIFRLCAC